VSADAKVQAVHDAHEDARSEAHRTRRQHAHELEALRIVNERHVRNHWALLGTSMRESDDFAGAVE